MDQNPMCMALSAVKVLRLEVGNLFTILSSGVKEEHGEDGREIITEIQGMLSTINHRYRELEQTVNNINIPPLPPGNLVLSNSSFLTQESSPDKQNLYSPLVRSHKWTDKVHKYSTLAYSILNSNSLKKSHHFNSSITKRKRPQSALHNIPLQQVEAFIANLDRNFSDMNITVSRSFVTNIVIQVTLGRVLQAMIAFKGITIEWVVIKGYTESCNSPADLMTDSRYHIFRRITDHAHAATLHYATPNSPEITVKAFLHWLNSFSSLFTSKCVRCGKHSYDCYPPTWRDFNTKEPYHFECKP